MVTKSRLRRLISGFSSTTSWRPSTSGMGGIGVSPTSFLSIFTLAQGCTRSASVPWPKLTVRLVTAPAEIFTETGMAIKRRSPLPYTLYAGYTNGSIGYVPVPEAYPEGGYEVTHACRVGPEAAGIITEASLELLAGV